MNSMEGRRKAPVVNPAIPTSATANFPEAVGGSISRAISAVITTVPVPKRVAMSRTPPTLPPSTASPNHPQKPMAGGTDAKPQSRCLPSARYSSSSRWNDHKPFTYKWKRSLMAMSAPSRWIGQVSFFTVVRLFRFGNGIACEA
jgi:hypothetical protein